MRADYSRRLKGFEFTVLAARRLRRKIQKYSSVVSPKPKALAIWPGISLKHRVDGHTQLMQKLPFLNRRALNCFSLGVQANASTKEIKDAYFSLAKKLHPQTYGPEIMIQYQNIYEAYDELKYDNKPRQFGNFPETSAQCVSYLQNCTSFDEAFIEACIEYDANMREFRDLQQEFVELCRLKPTTFKEDLRLLDQFRKKFAYLHDTFDQLHDVLNAIQLKSEPSQQFSLQSLTTFTKAKRKFWNAQGAYLIAQKDLLSHMDAVQIS